MKYFFDIKDNQIETGSTLYPFNKVSQIYRDFENNYYHTIMDNNMKFTITYAQYNEYLQWLCR